MCQGFSREIRPTLSKIEIFFEENKIILEQVE